ncbi:MAG: hypothetical protein LBG49_00975 [Mycoplasmataceae bacterium]|nr:hypothetical protein [Mycoplasmataceae bacterium]
MGSHLRLVSKIVFKKPINWFLMLILPIILTVIITFSYKVITELDIATLLPTTSTIPIITLGCLILPFVIYECRKNDIVFRLKLGSQSPTTLYMTMALFFSGLMFILYFINAGIASLFMMNRVNFKFVWASANFGMVFYSLFWLIACSIATGFLLGLLINNPSVLIVTGILLFLFSTVLAYIFISPTFFILFTGQKDGDKGKYDVGFNIAKIAAYFMIFHYPNGMLSESWFQAAPQETLFHSSIFNLSVNWRMAASYYGSQIITRTYLEVLTITDKWLNIFVPVFYTIFATGGCLLYDRFKKSV